jgi:two-component system nitrogen regulation sensor histidine kinase NtrY
VTLRAKLALAFALFAAVPLGVALFPVSRALSRALEAELQARLDAAARAVEGELARLAGEAQTAVADLAQSEEAEAFARDRAAGRLAPADEAGRAAQWMAARGLDVLAVASPDGRVLSSGHLPGRAGDVDPDLVQLFRGGEPDRAVPRVVARATPDGVAPVLALVSWSPVAGDESVRVAGGLALGPDRAARLAALAGGAVAIRAPGGALLEVAAADAAHAGASTPRLLSRLAEPLGDLGAPSRTLAIGPAERPAAEIEIRIASTGLAVARVAVLATFLAVLGAGTLAAGAAGSLLASRITRPLEALGRGAARLSAGQLGTRVEVRAAGEVGALVRAFNDMSAELAASRERLAHAERIAAWREVARRLAHELKNPLTPIAMSVETLRDARAEARPDFGEIFDEGTRAISEEVRRLKRIVDEFGRFARLPAPELAPVAPGDLVAAVRALFPSPAEGVSIDEDVDPGLPPVLADRDQILQVLLNLVQNALDAVRDEGRVRLGARRDGDAVELSVSDTGPGIAPGDLPRVFEPYFTTKEGGTGLGLAIAHRIAEEHGGALECRSAPGQTTFTLRLRIAGPAGATAPASP